MIQEVLVVVYRSSLCFLWLLMPTDLWLCDHLDKHDFGVSEHGAYTPCYGHVPYGT